MAGDDGRCGVEVAVVLRAGRQNNQRLAARKLWREGQTPKNPKSETETQNGTQGDPTQPRTRNLLL